MMASIAGCTHPARTATAGADTLGSAGSPSTRTAQVLLVCNGSTRPCPNVPHYVAVQAAVDAARPGDWILIWPGVYHENNPEYHAGVWITTPDLHIRGLSRNGVIIDGSHGTERNPCASSPGLQNFIPRDGIVVWKADGVTLQNLTVCDYLAAAPSVHGNQIWWDGGDGSGKIGLAGFQGSYLTATSMYHPADVSDQHLAQYGIYVGNTSGPGQITQSYASNMAEGAFYVGACRRVCDTVLSDDQGTNSALGFLGTNAGGSLVIRNSLFNDNRTGMAPSSLNNDDAPPPQDGRCLNSATRSCTLIENNIVSQNNNSNAPAAYGVNPPVGVGIAVDGGQFDIIAGNTITGNGSWGVLVNDSVDTLSHLPFSKCQGGYSNTPEAGLCLLPARGNVIYRNIFIHDASFGNLGDSDMAAFGLIASSASPRNCFYANRDSQASLTSVPAGIESANVDGPPCARPGTGGNTELAEQLECAALTQPCSVPHSAYPPRTRIDLTAWPVLPDMPHPCADVPRNAFCVQFERETST